MRLILLALLSGLACGLAVWVANFLMPPGVLPVFVNKDGRFVDEEGRVTDEHPLQRRERIIRNFMFAGAALGAVGGALIALCQSPLYGSLVGLLTGAAVGFGGVWWLVKPEPLAAAVLFAVLFGVCGAAVGAATAGTGRGGSGQAGQAGRDAWKKSPG
jgi:hypothetical protein